MALRDKIFVDTGAWIALALVRDPLHERAKEIWEKIIPRIASYYTSIPIVLETFTFLERNTNRHVALMWKDSLAKVSRLRIVTCTNTDMEQAWDYFDRKDLHKLSAVDATSFVLMNRLKIRVAFTFDHHFAVAGFKLL